MIALAALAAAAALCRAAPADYQETHRFDEIVKGVRYTVVFRGPTPGHHGGRLDIFTGPARKQTMVYTHVGALSSPELDPDQPPRRFSDLFKDGSRTLAYRMTNELSPTSKLFILRLKDGRFRKVGEFQEGKLLDVDGKPEVVSRQRPPGSTMIRCEEFHTDASSARVTTLFAWDGKGFVDISAKHPDFFAQRLPADEAKLAELKPQRLHMTGAYAGAALTLYFDEKAAGHPKEAWTRLNALIDADAKHPALLAWSHGKECVEKLRADVRERLQIPADW